LQALAPNRDRRGDPAIAREDLAGGEERPELRVGGESFLADLREALVVDGRERPAVRGQPESPRPATPPAGELDREPIELPRPLRDRRHRVRPALALAERLRHDRFEPLDELRGEAGGENDTRQRVGDDDLRPATGDELFGERLQRACRCEARRGTGQPGIEVENMHPVLGRDRSNLDQRVRRPGFEGRVVLPLLAQERTQARQDIVVEDHLDLSHLDGLAESGRFDLLGRQ
jgi:hypothetical protein